MTLNKSTYPAFPLEKASNKQKRVKLEFLGEPRLVHPALQTWALLPGDFFIVLFKSIPQLYIYINYTQENTPSQTPTLASAKSPSLTFF